MHGTLRFNISHLHFNLLAAEQPHFKIYRNMLLALAPHTWFYVSTQRLLPWFWLGKLKAFHLHIIDYTFHFLSLHCMFRVHMCYSHLGNRVRFQHLILPLSRFPSLGFAVSSTAFFVQHVCPKFQEPLPNKSGAKPEVRIETAFAPFAS